MFLAFFSPNSSHWPQLDFEQSGAQQFADIAALVVSHY